MYRHSVRPSHPVASPNYGLCSMPQKMRVWIGPKTIPSPPPHPPWHQSKVRCVRPPRHRQASCHFGHQKGGRGFFGQQFSSLGLGKTLTSLPLKGPLGFPYLFRFSPANSLELLGIKCLAKKHQGFPPSCVLSSAPLKYSALRQIARSTSQQFLVLGSIAPVMQVHISGSISYERSLPTSLWRVS